MLVSPLSHDQGWRLVTQRDHARMAGRIAEAWRADPAVSPVAWRAMIDASHRHDDGWAGYDDQPQVDPSGRPIDFKSISPAEHVTIWRRSLDAAEQRGPIEAWLTGLHAASLYERSSRHDPASQTAAAELLGEIEQRAHAWREAGAGLDPPLNDAQARRLARIVSWIDGLTLAMADAIPWPADETELVVAGRPVHLIATRLAIDRIGLAPWPIGPDRHSLDLELPARVAPYAHLSPHALRAVMDQPPTTMLRWSVVAT